MAKLVRAEVPSEFDCENSDAWLFDVIRSYVKGRTLEIESNATSIHHIFIQHHLPLHLSDPDEHNCSELERMFASLETVRNVHRIDLKDGNFGSNFPMVEAAFDTVLSLNTKRSYAFDQQIIANASFLLRRGGNLIVLMPATVVGYPGTTMDWDEIKVNHRPLLNNLCRHKHEILKTKYFDLDNPDNPGCADCARPAVVLVARTT